MEEQVLTLEEVARVLRVSRKTAEKLVHTGKIRAVKVGRVWRIPRSALEEFLRGGGHAQKEE
jgi:excisionase family DNA binding protein